MRIPHTVPCIVQFKSGVQWEEYQRSYRRIIDMYPDDIANAQIWKNTGSRILKVYIGLYNSVSEEKQQIMKRTIIDFVTSTFLPTLPGFSLPEEHVSFFLPEDTNNDNKDVTDVLQRANDAFAEVEVPSRVGVFSGVGLTLAQIMEVLRTKIFPPN